MTTTQSQRRPRRIAADEAHAWARNLRLGNPYAKLVLSMLTIYVNADGSCFVGIEQLAEDTELSCDTVRKRLAWLEQVGAIVRLPQWLDTNGRRNGEGRGKRTSDEIRLLIDADPDTIEARAKGEPAAEDTTNAGEISPSPQQGLDVGRDSVSPTVALCQPCDSGKGLISSNHEPEDSPPPPKGGEWQHQTSWEGFERAYPEPILRQTLAQNVWSALTDTERELATRAAEGYALHRRLQRKPANVLNAHTFLREPAAWPRYAELVKKTAEVTHIEMVDRDSREGRTLEALYTLARSSPPRSSDETKYVLKAPLTPQHLALADVPIDRKQWTFVDLPNATGAWLELMKPVVGRGPLVEDHIVGQRFVDGPDGKKIFTGNDLRRGFYAPWLWPPRVDGSIPNTTGPPPEPSDQEIQDFK